MEKSYPDLLKIYAENKTVTHFHYLRTIKEEQHTKEIIWIIRLKMIHDIE